MRILSLNPKLGVVARRSAQLCLVLVLAASLAGCSWFRKGDKKVDTTDDLPRETTVQTPQTDSTLPVDDPAEGTRPGVLSPIPEMQTINFDYDKSQIRASELAKMESNLAYIKANPDVKVYIVGHCDENGTIEYNFNLGTRRANAVRDYFTKAGVPVDQLGTLSKGEEEPIALGHSESAWAQNRRAEFKRMD